MKLLLLIGTICSFLQLQAQNVGIGTNNPQQKLHVAGNLRVEAIAGANGIMRYNANGDLVALPMSGDTNQVLRGDGGWGQLNGTIPEGTLVATTEYNNTNLLSRGFRFFGYIPGVTTFNTAPVFALANNWHQTYVEGEPEGFDPPSSFDANNIYFWVDSVMYVFAENQFHVYNPVTDTWRSGPANPTAFRASSGCKMVYTGSELIVWGGNFTSTTNNGFRYNPATEAWTAIPALGQPAARSQFGMQLINNRLVVWGGLSSGGARLNDGAVLNLATNTWSNTNAAGAPSARNNFSTVTNTLQNTMIVWGGSTAGGLVNDGASYNPVTNSWSAITNVNAPVARSGHTAIWSGTEMIVYGGNGTTADLAYMNTGARYNPATNTWTNTSTTGAPRLQSHGAIWTGSRMLISGGSDNYLGQVGRPFSGNSYTYDPVANTWQSAGFMVVLKALYGDRKSVV